MMVLTLDTVSTVKSVRSSSLVSLHARSLAEKGSLLTLATVHTRSLAEKSSLLTLATVLLIVTDFPSLQLRVMSSGSPRRRSWLDASLVQPRNSEALKRLASSDDGWSKSMYTVSHSVSRLARIFWSSSVGPNSRCMLLV